MVPQRRRYRSPHFAEGQCSQTPLQSDYTAKRGIGFEALDNGILRCDDRGAIQAIAREGTAQRIDAVLRKWLERESNDLYN